MTGSKTLVAGAVPVSAVPPSMNTHGAQGSGARPVSKPAGGSGSYFPPSAQK